MAEREIGNYRVLKQIGAGGMAKVYLAVHKDVPNLKVVLKILSDPRHAAGRESCAGFEQKLSPALKWHFLHGYDLGRQWH